jgi:hypothetical protein
MIQNKIVVRYLDGRIVKGVTADFMPNKEFFHVTPLGAQAGEAGQLVNIKECKAIFFVKDYQGDSSRRDMEDFQEGKAVVGRKIKVVFNDSEAIVGTTQGYQPGRPGFFLFPADPKSNIDRCFVVAASAKSIAFMEAPRH